ncbi:MULTISPECIES: DUF5689 domain-containing protein [Pedobacter]|uniref:DUF5689 domain-containing protein n=1 Tax=Pedobacter TaxID=84567 RepID=UPI00210DD158|nr:MULTISPECIES: DUF5689 domain-containing protein [unclassified Pedobacter]
MNTKNISYLVLFICILGCTGCKYNDGYDGGMVSSYISNFDLRKVYKGSDVTLTTANLLGATSIRGVVVSDHSGNNMPAGLLAVQNTRPVGAIDSLRGISIALGPDAATYVPGDSVHVRIEGGVLTRKDGILQITGLPASNVNKVASDRFIPVNRVPSSAILARPNDYESTLVAIVKAGFDPIAGEGDTYSGDKTINDGFDNFTLYTAPTATFANRNGLNFNANYYGIVFNTVDANGKLKPQHRIRTLNDIQPLSSTPDIAAIIISGFMADLEGGDGNYEYMQFLATRDINFSVTPYSVVVTNNAGASNPGGFPSLGWATGSLATSGNARTYKFNLTSGTVAKGQYFYVGGSAKLINGPNSTSISSAKWIRSFNYSTTNGDGFGLKTSGLFANSGNASGFAVFEGTDVDVNKAPIDVVFIGAGGSLFNGSTVGYRIANTDFYDKIDPITLKPQPFYRSGGNTLSFNYTLPADQGFWNMLGGVYNETLGKWVKARTQNNIDLSKTSTLRDIEGNWLRQSLDNDGNVVRTDTIAPTKLKSQL